MSETASVRPALTDLTASELADGLRRRSFSCRELMQATVDRIHALNPIFNTIVNMAPVEKLLAEADAADADLASGKVRGWLHGIPMAVKDFADVVGFPTTKGCELLASNMPTSDSILTAPVILGACVVEVRQVAAVVDDALRIRVREPHTRECRVLEGRPPVSDSP